MKLLAVDTSTEACSAALLIGGEVRARYRLAPREHTQLILPMIDELMGEAGLKPRALDALAFGRGPGSFTGLRIAAGVVQGIAFAADLPVVPVSSLAAVAQGVYREQGVRRVLAAIDARIQEIYWGVYQVDDQGLAHLIEREILCSPRQIPIPGGNDWHGAGTAWEVYHATLRQQLGAALAGWYPQRFPAAHDVALLAAAAYARGEAVAAERAQPVYLRDEVAVIKN